MKYKALRYFKTAKDYETYLRKTGDILDSVNIGGIDYTMHEYDMNGQNINYANQKHCLMFDVDIADRYKYGFGDAKVSESYEPLGLRNDIVYLD